MAKVSAKGGFHLLWGLVLSTVISSVGTILISIFLGADNMGLYAIAVAAPNLIANFRDWGITTAMVKYSAQYNHQNDPDKIRSIFVSGLAFELILGLIPHNILNSHLRLPSPSISTTRNSPTNPNNVTIHPNRCTRQHGNSCLHRPRKNASKQHHANSSIHS